MVFQNKIFLASCFLAILGCLNGQCVQYSSAFYDFNCGQTSSIASSNIPTENSDPIPCCQACANTPCCVVYEYVINNGDDAVCNLFSSTLESDKNQYYSCLRRNDGNGVFIGFTYSYISLK